MSTLILHETTAASSASYGPLAVPGLLQAEEYATELIGAEGLEPGIARYRVDARMERQRELHGGEFAFFIHEQALRLPVGSGRVMNEQLLKIVLLAALGARSLFDGEFWPRRSWPSATP